MNMCENMCTVPEQQRRTVCLKPPTEWSKTEEFSKFRRDRPVEGEVRSLRSGGLAHYVVGSSAPISIDLLYFLETIRMTGSSWILQEKPSCIFEKSEETCFHRTERRRCYKSKRGQKKKEN